jgi:ADP-ribose pyrophosphatase
MEIIKKKIEFHTPWFDLVAKTIHDPSDTQNKDAEYYSISANDYVCIVAFTPEEKIILVTQYRPAVEGFTIELPAGYVDDNETPLDASKRELQEETGYLCEHVQLLGCLSPDTGRLGNRQWCFYADNVVLKEQQPDSPEKGITRLLLSKAELKEHIIAGKFNHALHLASIYLAILNKKLVL